MFKKVAWGLCQRPIACFVKTFISLKSYVKILGAHLDRVCWTVEVLGIAGSGESRVAESKPYTKFGVKKLAVIL